MSLKTENSRGVAKSRPVCMGLNAGFPLANFLARSDLFILSASILPRLADVISDTDKGKRSLRARKFASGNRLNEKPA